MIIKPGEQAPLTVARMVELVQEVLPEDVVQFMPGFGPEVPQALVTHSLVKMVSFTVSKSNAWYIPTRSLLYHIE